MRYVTTSLMKDLGPLIGKNITALRKEAGMTQASLAEQAGIKVGYLSELINGHPEKRWNVDHINELAKVLKVEPYVLCVPDKIRDLIDLWEGLKSEEIALFKKLLVAASEKD